MLQVIFFLTSANKGVDIFDLPDVRVVAVRDQGHDGVQKAIHVKQGPGVPQQGFKLAVPLRPILVHLGFGHLF